MNAADQMGDDKAAAHFGGGGGGPRVHVSGGPGGGMRMSGQEAEAFFSQFFGNSDPFGGSGQRSGQRMSGGFGRGGPDPISMMFGGGGMPGGMGGHPMGGSIGGGMPLGSGVQQQRPTPKRYDAIPNGTVVSLKDLIGQPERNGDRGEIAGYDPSSGRYTVALEDSEEYLKVKPHNLLQHVHVNLHGIESQPALNEKRGTIIAWNNHKERYNIYVMELSKVVSLRPSNIILDNGTVGKIQGLNAKPELNGKFGTIKAWIRESNRYDVQLSESQVVRIKVDNIRV